MARWFARQPFAFQLDRPIVSFTFDDFPQSALLTGGPILKHHGYLGTYYTSFGLMGTHTPTGKAFEERDLEEFVHQGHELACHTFDHCDSWQTPPRQFDESIRRNQSFVRQHLPAHQLQSLSYPISYPRPQTKRLTARHYACARGAGQTFNHGKTDLNYLKAFFLEQSRDDFDAIARTVDATARSHGWLIFATHDIAVAPTRFGVTPQLFQKTVDYVARSGCQVLPVEHALTAIRGSNHSNGK